MCVECVVVVLRMSSYTKEQGRRRAGKPTPPPRGVHDRTTPCSARLAEAPCCLGVLSTSRLIKKIARSNARTAVEPAAALPRAAARLRLSEGRGRSTAVILRRPFHSTLLLGFRAERIGIKSKQKQPKT